MHCGCQRIIVNINCWRYPVSLDSICFSEKNFNVHVKATMQLGLRMNLCHCSCHSNCFPTTFFEVFLIYFDTLPLVPLVVLLLGGIRVLDVQKRKWDKPWLSRVLCLQLSLSCHGAVRQPLNNCRWSLSLFFFDCGVFPPPSSPLPHISMVESLYFTIQHGQGWGEKVTIINAENYRFSN
jgi:hypothetical protein